MVAEAYGSASCTSALMPESKLSHKPEAHYGFVPKLSRHGGKTPRFALKNLTSNKKTQGLEKGFICFSSDDVFCCAATSGVGVFIHIECFEISRHCFVA